MTVKFDTRDFSAKLLEAHKRWHIHAVSWPAELLHHHTMHKRANKKIYIIDAAFIII